MLEKLNAQMPESRQAAENHLECGTDHTLYTSQEWRHLEGTILRYTAHMAWQLHCSHSIVQTTPLARARGQKPGQNCSMQRMQSGFSGPEKER